ncbi:unnamed protein product [Arctogadus glacialis]
MWSSRCRGNGGAVTCARDRQRRAARYKGGARAAPRRKKKKTPASPLIPLLSTPRGGSRSPRHEDPDDEKRLVPVLPRLMSVAPGELSPDEEETGSLCFEAAGEKMRDAGDVVGGLPRRSGVRAWVGWSRATRWSGVRAPIIPQAPSGSPSYPTSSTLPRPPAVPTPPPPPPTRSLPHHLHPPQAPSSPYPTHLHPPQAPSGPPSYPTSSTLPRPPAVPTPPPPPPTRSLPHHLHPPQAPSGPYPPTSTPHSVPTPPPPPSPGPQRSLPHHLPPHSVPTPPPPPSPGPQRSLPHHLPPPLGPYPTTSTLPGPQGPYPTSGSPPHSVPTPPPPPSTGPQRSSVLPHHLHPPQAPSGPYSWQPGRAGPLSIGPADPSDELHAAGRSMKRSMDRRRRPAVHIPGISSRFSGSETGSEINQIPNKYSQAESTKFMVLTVVSLLCTAAVPLASTVVYCLRHRSHHRLKQNFSSLGGNAPGDATSTYQELCRQRMAVKPPSEPLSSRITSVSSQFSDGGGGGGAAVSPSARGSTSSWGEEPSHSNMDISTGHMILAYMEDHLKNKNRLEKEWEALCCYQAEPNASTAGLRDGNAKRNRSSAVVAYDHSRISLKVENSQGNSDYINASPIMDHDPRSPAYIATQGPLPSTVADFWQMVWENGCVVIVMLTPLVEGGVKQCYHYWPDEGSNLYHIYEVNLVSEHIWCDDFLVRSFYLKNMQTNETRTVTQFHFLTWPGRAAPASSRSLLDLRRKVNRCYKGRSCPIIVHCSDGAGRTGTYILIDMVLNKMAKGAKEIDIAATLEHLRDQRPGMVQTKEQFEFVLTAIAEEVNVILKALPQ